MSETNEKRAIHIAVAARHALTIDEAVTIIAKALDDADCRAIGGDLAEARGIALGRAAERRDVVAWFREVYDGTFERHVFEQIASGLESGAHLPAKENPDADE
jgi:hypothetical protein